MVLCCALKLATRCKWLPQFFLIWWLLQIVTSKTTLPGESSTFLSLCMLISYSCWSSGHLSLPPGSHCDGDLCLTQPVSLQYFQSIHPTSLFMKQHWQLWCSLRDSVRRKQKEGLQDGVTKSTIVYSKVLDLHIHLPLSHWLTQSSIKLSAPFMVCALNTVYRF